MSRIKPTAGYYNILWRSYELSENKGLAVSSFSLSQLIRIVITNSYAYIFLSFSSFFFKQRAAVIIRNNTTQF